MRRWVLAALGGALVLGAAPARAADGRETCAKGADADLRIAACTRELNQFPPSAAFKAELYDNRGLAHLEKGELDAALADISKAISLRADDGTLHFHRGLVYLRLHDHERALQAFDVALARTHDLAPALVARGHEHLYRRDVQKALADLDRAIRLYPKFADAYGERCFARAVAGLDGALSDCEAAIRLAPDAPEFVQTRAFAEYRARRYDEALRDLDAVLSKAPANIGARYLRGVVRRHMGDAPGAKADLDAAAAHPEAAAEWAAFGVI